MGASHRPTAGKPHPTTPRHAPQTGRAAYNLPEKDGLGRRTPAASKKNAPDGTTEVLLSINQIM